jgi:hypothetical protein
MNTTGPPYELRFDLAEVEGNPFADFAVAITDPEADHFMGQRFPAGVTVSANRGSHGADVHLTWPQTRDLRDVLTRLLREAGQE